MRPFAVTLVVAVFGANIRAPRRRRIVRARCDEPLTVYARSGYVGAFLRLLENDPSACAHSGPLPPAYPG